MKGSLFVIVLVSLLAVQTYSQKRNVPSFGQYPARVEKARAHGIDFKRNPDARTFRTRLSEALAGGVNFAVHFIVVGWGCDTGRTNAAIIEARTGDVIWPDQFMNIDASYGDGYSDEQLEFKKNSRLLIIHGRPGHEMKIPGFRRRAITITSGKTTRCIF